MAANALQHTPAGGTVTLRLQHAGDRALVWVVDTGPGIPPEQQPWLFERFWRGDRARSSGGAGLGLAIVKWVAEAHGGGVILDSTVGHGATFTLALPTRPASSPQPAPALPVDEAQASTI